MTKFLVVILILGIVSLLAIAARRPNHFRYARSLLINAPMAKIFAEVNDLHKWEAWSPWAKMDPAAKTVFAGPESGIGAAMSWDGNNKVGAGTMTITQSSPPDKIILRLDFKRPMTAVNTAEFLFEPQGEQTLVTWSVYGPTPFIGKVISLVMNCEKMMAGNLSDGLHNLQAVVEAKTS